MRFQEQLIQAKTQYGAWHILCSNKVLNKGLSRIDIPIWICKGEEIRGLKALRGRWL